jgi:hypothetical protein
MVKPKSTFLRVMSLVQRVKPHFVCDDCIAEKVGADLAEVAAKTNELAGIVGYRRSRALCSLCRIEERVIAFRP